MRIRAFVLIAVTVIAVASCTGAPQREQRSGDRSVPNETLLLATAGGPLAVDVPSGHVVVDARNAVASTDGARLYEADATNGRTSLRTINAATGAELSHTVVPGDLSVRVVSWDGSHVALMPPLAPGQDAWTPVPQTETTITVADPSGKGRPVRYRLHGNYAPEAFSIDHAYLFLIQYLPADAPTVYRVTKLDLAAGRVEPVLSPYKAPAERMPGERLEQVASADDSKLFTLYTSERPGFAPHDAPVPRNAIVSFVHVLSLAEGWAHCIGLPKVLWHQPASAEAMALSPDGSTLYIVDADKGVVVTMDTTSLDTSGPYRVELPSPGQRTTATVSPDGGTLFVGTAAGGGHVTAVDTSTYDVTDRWSTGGGVSGIGMSLDGTRLYVALDGRLEVLNAASGQDLGDVGVASPAPIQAISAIAG
ncbi:MAG: YncE family protein [Actinomycetota bacterium]